MNVLMFHVWTLYEEIKHNFFFINLPEIVLSTWGYCHAKVSVTALLYLKVNNASLELPEDMSLLGRGTA